LVSLFYPKPRAKVEKMRVLSNSLVIGFLKHQKPEVFLTEKDLGFLRTKGKPCKPSHLSLDHVPFQP
jgi:hypothetical protein